MGKQTSKSDGPEDHDAVAAEPSLTWRRFFTLLRVAASWPVVGMIVALMITPQIVRLLDVPDATTENVDIRGAGMEVAVDTIRDHARRYLEAAADQPPSSEEEVTDAPVDPFGETWIRQFAAHSHRFRGRTILWLTDEPDGFEERWALELLTGTLGANVIVVGSVDSASTLLRRDSQVWVHGVIADFDLDGRRPECATEDERAAVCQASEGWGSQILYDWTTGERPAALMPPTVFLSTTAARCDCDAALRHAGSLGATTRLDDTLLLIAQRLPPPEAPSADAPPASTSAPDGGTAAAH